MLPLLFLACSLKLNHIKQVNYMTNPSVWQQGVFRINSYDEAKICQIGDDEGETCEVFNGQSSGSGFAVVTTKEKDKSHIVTAAHVCSPEMAPPIDVVGLVLNGLELVEFKRALFVDDGISQIEAKIIALDYVSDTCLLEIKADVNKEFEISDVYPAYSEEVYNIGAPAGFYSAGAKFYLEGHYVGVEWGHSPWAVKPYLHQVFSIPGVGGLSGSPLINKEGKIIGMIHSIRMDYPYITFSCTIEDLKRLISYAE